MTQNATTQHNAQNSANNMEPASPPADWNVERLKKISQRFKNASNQ